MTEVQFFNDFLMHIPLIAFSALTLLVGHHEEHLACKKISDEVLV